MTVNGRLQENDGANGPSSDAWRGSLSLASAVDVLSRAGLLREVIADGRWTLDPAGIPHADDPFTGLVYDTRRITPGALLCCKGRFRADYLRDADARGLAAYVAETDLSDATRAPGMIVDDARQALGLLAAEWYGHPERQLTLIGITGTKGKTTTAWLLHAILDAATRGRCALFSSVANTVDGHTMQESSLTTPESLDAMRMMRQAVANGMTHLVMEVSSQAYKVHRVDALTFDAGAFLNISPDHISPIEHPTFEDYLYCKRRIVTHSRRLVLGADSAHADLLRQDAHAAGIPVTTFALHDARRHTPADITVKPLHEDSSFSISLGASGGSRVFDLHPSMPGEVNALNAAAAVSLALAVGVEPEGLAPALHAMERVTVPGRMERLISPDGIIGYVDFAHNGSSTAALLDYVADRYGNRNPRVILVTGSAGGKAIDRRREIVQAAQGRVESYVFTLDDPNFEDPRDIAEAMQSEVHDQSARTTIVIPREDAIHEAVADARRHPSRFNVILVIGKGEETCNIIRGEKVPYAGDAAILGRELDSGADRHADGAGPVEGS